MRGSPHFFKRDVAQGEQVIERVLSAPDAEAFKGRLLLHPNLSEGIDFTVAPPGKFNVYTSPANAPEAT